MANRRLTYQIGIIADTKDLQASLNEAIKSLNNLGKQTQLVSNLQQASTAALDLASNLQKAISPETGKLDLSLFNENLNRSGKQLKDYHDDLVSLGEDGQNAFLKVADTITKAELPLKRTNKLMNDLWITMKNTIRWQITTGVLNTFTGSINTAFGYAKDLDSSLNSIRIVTGQSAEEMKEFAKQANEAAKALSTTTTDYTEASLIYYQQGLNNAEVEERTNATIKMANVSGQNAETASEQLTAIWNNFDDGSKALEYYADVMVALGASTASSSDEIAKGIQKFAAVADTVGLSYEYAAAALATLVSNTREAPEVVGNALKTLFARIQGLQLGETLDDGTDLNKYSKALNEVGVNIKDTNGELKAMDQILTETAVKWQTLSKDQQTALAQTVAGVRQYNQFISLMENWPDMMENVATAMGSEGALQEQADIYAESWEAARDRVRASAEDIYDSLINPDFYIGMDKAITPVLNRVADIIDAFGGMQGTLAVLATLMNKVYGQQIAQSMRDMVTSLGFMTGKQQEQARLVQQQAADLAKSLQFAKSDDAWVNQRVDASKELVRLQGEIASYLDKLTPRQQEQLQQDAQHIQNIYKLITAYSESATQANTAFEASKIKIQENAKAVNDFKAKLDNLKFNDKFNIKLDTTNASAALDQLLSKLKELAPQYKNLSRINEEMERLSLLPGNQGQGRGASEEILELAKAFELVDENADRYDDFFTGTTNNYKQQTQELKVVVDTLKETLVSVFNIPEAEADRYIKALQEVRSGEIGVNNATELLNTSIEKVSNNIRQGTYAQKDWADILVATGSALSQLSMAINSIQSIRNIFNDSDLSIVEKMTMLLTNVGMLLPILVSGYKSFNNALGINIALKEGEAKVTGKAFTGKIAETVATKALTKGIAEETAAQMANNAVKLISLGYYAAIIAIIGVVVAALIKYINRVKDAQEAIQSLHDAYEEEKNKLEDINNELEITNNRMDELLAKDSLTIVEQEELNKLREQNALLERQKIIQEELTKAAQKREIAGILADYEDATEKLVDFNGRVTSYWDGAVKTFTPEEFLETHGGRGGISTKDLEEYERITEEFNEGLVDIKEHWDKAEQIYSSLAQALQDNLYENDPINQQRIEDAVENLKERLKNVREASLGEQGYFTAYIQPAIDNTALSKVKAQILSLGDITGKSDQDILSSLGLSQQEIGEAIKSLDLFGIKLKDAIYVYQEVLNTAREGLKRVFKGSSDEFVDNFLQQFSDEDLNLVLSLNWDEDAANPINTVQDLYLAMAKVVAKTHDWTLSLNEAKDAAHQTMETLAGGDRLDAETVQNLQTLFSGIYDLSNLDYISTYEQALQIGQAFASLSNVTPAIDAVNNRLHDNQNRLKEVRKELNELGFSSEEAINSMEELPENWDEIQDKLSEEAILTINIEEAQKQLEQLNNFELDPIEVEIAGAEALVAQIGQINKAASLIGEGFKVQAKDVEELVQTLPELFYKSVVDMETGIVQLNQAVVEEVSAAALETANVQARGLGESLQARIDATTAEIGLIRTVKEVAVTESGNAVKAISANRAEELKNAQIVAKAILRAKLTQAAQEVGSSQTVAAINIDGQNQMANASAENSIAIANNYIDAFNDMGQKATNVFKGIINLMNDPTAAGPTVQAGFSGTGVRWGGSSYVYHAPGKIENPITDVLHWLDTGEIRNVGADENSAVYEALKNQKAQEFSDLITNIMGAEVVTAHDILTRDWINIEQSMEDLLGKTGFAEALDAADSQLSKEVGLLTNALSQIASAQGAADALKNAGLKDSKSGSDKQKYYTDEEEKKLEDILERYHEINREITRQSDLLDDISNNTERVYGVNKLKNYNKELKALEKQQDNYNQKLKEATEQWLPYDLDKLNNLFGEGVIQYKANGEIANYTQLLQKTVDDYNDKFLSQYNSFMKKYTETTDEDAKKLLEKEKSEWEQRKALAEEQYKSRQDALKQYEDTRDIIQEIKNELEDVARQIQDNKLSQIEYKLKIVLDVKSMKDALREFDKQAQEIFGDALTHGTGAMNRLGITDRLLNIAELDKTQAQAEADMYSSYAEQFHDLKALYEEANDATDRDRIMQDIMDLQGKVLDSAEAIVEWVNSIEDLIPDAVSAAAERFKIFTDQLDHNTSVLDTIKELYALQGVTYKTMEGFNKLQTTSQEKLEAQIANAQLQRAQYNEALQNLQEAQARLDSLGGDEGDIRYDTYKKARDAYLAEFNETQEAYLSLAKEAMETAKDMYLEQIDKAIYDFGQKVSKGLGLDLLQDKYDHFIEQDERYFDKVNEAYQTLSWYNKLQEDIDKTTDNAQKERLLALQKEIDLRREGGKLSQYDLDILNAKYNILQAQAALEDAQNAKNQIRLVRDRQGNWNYQYTADPVEVENKEQELLDAQIEWYNIAKEQVNKVTGEIISTWQECQDKIKEIYTDMTLTDQERSDKAAEIYKYYTDKIKYLEEEKQVAIKDMNEAGTFNTISTIKIAGKEVVDSSELTADEVKAITEAGWDDILGIVTEGGDALKDIMGENAEIVDIFDNVYAKDLDNMTNNTYEFEDALRETLDRAQQNFFNFEDVVQDVADQTGTSMEDLSDTIDQVSDSTDELRDRGLDAADVLWDLIDAAEEAAYAYADMADGIWQTIEALRELAQQQMEYVESAAGGDSYDDFDTGIAPEDIDDYSLWFAQQRAQGKNIFGSDYSQYWDYREQKRGPNAASVTNEQLESIFRKADEGNANAQRIIEGVLSGEKFHDLIKQYPVAFATGGYTGEFQNGKLALLHEKELVLNKDDTKNMLDAVSIVRDVSPNILASIEKALDSKVIETISLLATSLNTQSIEPTVTQLDQTIHIDEVTFPNVSSSDEIKNAFASIANDAVQWAKVRRM